MPSVPEEELRVQVKQELRRRMGGLRSTLPVEARARRSARIAEHVEALDEFRSARCLLAFVAVRGEADPAPLVARARATGKLLALPRVDRKLGGLVLHPWAEDAPLLPGAYGIPEPPADSPSVPPDGVDFVLVPALALDERGHRIGYGKGYYDRLLPTLTRATSCGIAYDFQLVAEVPDLPGDQRVDLVATDERVIDTR